MRPIYEPLRRRKTPIVQPFKDRDRTLFRPLQRLKPLLVMIDWDLFSSNGDEKTRYLIELLSQEPIRRYWYGDNDPPEDFGRENYNGIPYVDQWIIVSPPDQYGDRGAVYPCAKGERGILQETLVPSGAFEKGPQDWTIPKSYGDGIGAIKKVKSDLLAALVADSVKVDIFVTNREFLFSDDATFFKDISILRPEDALPLVGLYLREQGQFITQTTNCGNGRMTLDRRSFYYLAALGMLPAAWRFINASKQHAGRSGNIPFFELASTVLSRTNQLIRSRDRLSVALYLPQDDEARETALLEIDAMLIYLMSNLDVIARVAHAVLNLRGDIRYVGWQRKEWVELLGKQCPRLAELVQGDSTGRQILDILPPIRNSIHSQAIRSLAYMKPGHPKDSRLQIPSNDIGRVMRAISTLGGFSKWGLEEDLTSNTNTLIFDPYLLMENLIAETLHLANDLMHLIPFEELPGLLLTESDLEMPQSIGHDNLRSKRVLWQLGLS